MGIIDDYFEGYFSQEMIESQVCTQFVLIFVYVYKLLSYMCYLLSYILCSNLSGGPISV